MKHFVKALIFFTVFILGVDTNALASEQQADITPFEKACAGTNIPPKLALAIAHHESGLNPFAVNVAGTGYLPESKEQALEIIKDAENRGASYDVGLMQINNQWFQRLGITPESLLEPEKNLDTGVKILAGEFERHGKNWTAVGYYHSPTSWRGKAYSWKVYNLYHGEISPSAPAPAKSTKMRETYAKQETSHQNLSDGSGVWRNPATSKANRLVSFKIRSQNIIRLSGSKPGKPTGPAGTSED